MAGINVVDIAELFDQEAQADPRRGAIERRLPNLGGQREMAHSPKQAAAGRA